MQEGENRECDTMTGEERDVQTYLARIRKTIADSKSLISQAELRMAETDRMLERQGLTREQVMNFHFTEAQREAANAELKRHGMEPIGWDDGYGIDRDAEDAYQVSSRPSEPAPDSDLAERQRKFGMMMKPFQI